MVLLSQQRTPAELKVASPNIVFRTPTPSPPSSYKSDSAKSFQNYTDWQFATAIITRVSEQRCSLLLHYLHLSVNESVTLACVLLSREAPQLQRQYCSWHKKSNLKPPSAILVWFTCAPRVTFHATKLLLQCSTFFSPPHVFLFPSHMNVGSLAARTCNTRWCKQKIHFVGINFKTNLAFKLYVARNFFSLSTVELNTGTFSTFGKQKPPQGNVSNNYLVWIWPLSIPHNDVKHGHIESETWRLPAHCVLFPVRPDFTRAHNFVLWPTRPNTRWRHEIYRSAAPFIVDSLDFVVLEQCKCTKNTKLAEYFQLPSAIGATEIQRSIGLRRFKMVHPNQHN